MKFRAFAMLSTYRNVSPPLLVQVATWWPLPPCFGAQLIWPAFTWRCSSGNLSDAGTKSCGQQLTPVIRTMRRYNYTKIQAAMAEKAQQAAASADVERQPILQMASNGVSSPTKNNHTATTR